MRKTESKTRVCISIKHPRLKMHPVTKTIAWRTIDDAIWALGLEFKDATLEDVEIVRLKDNKYHYEFKVELSIELVDVGPEENINQTVDGIIAKWVETFKNVLYYQYQSGWEIKEI